jgi:hypothetical protein
MKTQDLYDVDYDNYNMIPFSKNGQLFWLYLNPFVGVRDETLNSGTNEVSI